MDLRFSGGGLVEGREIFTLLKRLGLPDRIEDLDLPFAAVATDLGTGREVWLREGRLDLAVRASVAMPGVISPLHHQGQWLLDGGMVNPVPVSLARALGADIIIASHPNARLDGALWRAPTGASAPNANLSMLQDRLPEALKGLLTSEAKRGVPRAPGYLEVLSTSIDIMTDHIHRTRMAGEPPQVMLSADLTHLSVLDFHEAAQAIADGRRMVADHAALLDRIAASLVAE